MTDIHDFIECFNEIADEIFPNTTRRIVFGSDLIKNVVMELNEEDRGMRYSPYELYNRSNSYKDTKEEFVKQWKTVLQ